MTRDPRTVGPEDIEAIRILHERERDALHQVPANAFQAYQLALIALRNDRRVPDDVVEAVRQKLGAVVYGVHYGLMQEAS